MLFHSSIDICIISFSGITTRVLDVTKNDAILELAKEVDKIDVLFNCAGYGPIDFLFSVNNQLTLYLNFSDMFTKETFLNVVKLNGTEASKSMLKVCTECVMLSFQRYLN